MPEIRTEYYRACFFLFSDFVRLSVSIFMFGYVMFVSQLLRNVSDSFVVHIWLLTQPPAYNATYFYYYFYEQKMPKKTERGIIWNFSATILSQNSEKIEGGPSGEIFFPKKVSQ